MNKKSKLKRDRKKVLPFKEEILFPESNDSRIITRQPTPEDPAIRRFIPTPGLNETLKFRQLGILDWREKSLANASRENNLPANKIICGDSLAVLKRFPDNSIDCIITSPPYWNIVDYGFEGQLGFCSYEEYLKQLLLVWKECERILCPNGKLCINTPIMPISKKVIPGSHTRHIKNINNDIESVILAHLRLERYSLYIWQKQTTEKMFGSYPYPPNIYEQNTIEFINVFVKPGQPKKLSKKIKEQSRLSEKEWMNLTQQIWKLYPEDVKRVNHPAPFPESLPNRLIAMYTFAEYHDEQISFPGDLVLDPFCGTGATCVAAKKLGRRFIGIDLSPDFCITAAERISRAHYDGKIFIISTWISSPSQIIFRNIVKRDSCGTQLRRRIG